MTEAAAQEKKPEAKGAETSDLGTTEDQARRMGWSPKEEFRGAPEKWTDAETFVKNGMESLPILRERNRTLQRSVEDLTKSVGEFKKMSDTAYERAYSKAKKELEAEVKRAAKAGDEQGAAAASTELADLEADKAKREAVKDQDDPVFNNWAAENAWYNDPDLKVEAEGEAFKLRKRGEKSEGVAFLDKVKEKIKERFPEKFANPRRQGNGSVERASPGGDETASRGKKGWDSLPADAKAAGERYVKQKLFKDKQAYAESYWQQN